MKPEQYEYLKIPRISIHEVEELLTNVRKSSLLEKVWLVNANAFGRPPNKEEDYRKWLAGNTHIMTLESNGEVIGAAEYTQRMVGIRPKGAILDDFEENVLKEKWNKRHHKMCVGTSVLYINTLYIDPKHAGKGRGVELQKKLIEYINPAYIVSFSKNIQFIAAQKKAAEENNMCTYVGGIPVGDYPLYLGVYELLEQISAQWYKDFNELFLFLDEPNQINRLPDEVVFDRFQKNMWEYRQRGVGVKMIGFSRGGKVRDEPLRGDVVHPKEDSLLGERLGKIFTILDFWNNLDTYRSFTLPVVTIDPTRFPAHAPLGKFHSTEYSINPFTRHSPFFRHLEDS